MWQVRKLTNAGHPASKALLSQPVSQCLSSGGKNTVGSSEHTEKVEAHGGQS